MAQPNAGDMLTAEELYLLNDLLVNRPLMGALEKVFAYDQKVQSESIENEALTNEPSVNRIIQLAARKRASKEFRYTIESRMKTLGPQQR